MPNNINNVNNLSSIDALNRSDKTDGSKNIDFAAMLKDSINKANAIQKDSEQSLSDIATGQVKDLHQAAIAINKAETHMKLMLEMRNKAILAYKEILKTQI